MSILATAAIAGFGAWSKYNTNKTNARSASQANQANLEQGALNREFQAKAYQHRYQWQVKDMRAAGLNPMLSYDQSPGSAPSGAQGQAKAYEERQDSPETITALATTALAKEKTKTEQTVQQLNRSITSKNKGMIKLPGLVEMPIEEARKMVMQGLANKKITTARQQASRNRPRGSTRSRSRKYYSSSQKQANRKRVLTKIATY